MPAVDLGPEDPAHDCCSGRWCHDVHVRDVTWTHLPTRTPESYRGTTWLTWSVNKGPYGGLIGVVKVDDAGMYRARGDQVGDIWPPVNDPWEAVKLLRDWSLT